jgi:hypothetical protein
MVSTFNELSTPGNARLAGQVTVVSAMVNCRGKTS